MTEKPSASHLAAEVRYYVEECGHHLDEALENVADMYGVPWAVVEEAHRNPNRDAR